MESGCVERERMFQSRIVESAVQGGTAFFSRIVPPLIKRNAIFNNALTGITIGPGTAPDIRQNLILENGIAAVSIEAEAKPLIYRNTIARNGREAFTYVGRDQLHVTSNIFFKKRPPSRLAD